MTALNVKLAQTRAEIVDDRTPTIVEGLSGMRNLVRSAMRRLYKDNWSELRISQIAIKIGDDRSWSVSANMPDVFAKMDNTAVATMTDMLAHKLPASALPCDMLFDIWHPTTGAQNVELLYIVLGGRKVEPVGRTVDAWKNWLAYVVDTEFFIDDLVHAISNDDMPRRIFLPLQSGDALDRIYAATREAAAITFLIRGAGLHAIHALTGDVPMSEVLETHHLTGVQLVEVTDTPLTADIGGALHRLSDFIESRRALTDDDLQPDH